jgi:hypothetical protein
MRKGTTLTSAVNMFMVALLAISGLFLISGSFASTYGLTEQTNASSIGISSFLSQTSSFAGNVSNGTLSTQISPDSSQSTDILSVLQASTIKSVSLLGSIGGLLVQFVGMVMTELFSLIPLPEGFAGIIQTVVSTLILFWVARQTINTILGRSDG